MGQANKRGTREERVAKAVEKKENDLKARQELNDRLTGANKTDIRGAAALALVMGTGIMTGGRYG